MMSGMPQKTLAEPHWTEALADRVLAGEAVTRDEARALLKVPDDELVALLEATLRVRERYWGRRVKLCQLRNARSGICPEDCNYCSQSTVSSAEIPRYRLDSVEQLLDGARNAVKAGARRYCMVTSGRGPSEQDVGRFSEAARSIKGEFPELELCVSAGITEESQARELKDAGIGWLNHNLNTSERFHPEICTTHEYADRTRTIVNARRAGLSTCCGGILGMGESHEDVVDLAFALRDLEVDSLPVNFLHPIDGTPLSGRDELTPTYCLKALSLFRFTNPRADIRVAGGREVNLGWFQPMAFYAANSIFVDGYLTTPGQAATEAREMITGIGFEVE